MKKILAALCFLIIVLAAFLGWQRYQAQLELSQLSRGKTYSNFGIKLQIPPESGQVRGWFQPYLDLPRVILEFGAWGKSAPFNLEGGKLKASWYKRGGLVLEFPKVISPHPVVSIDHLSFELQPQDQIRKISARSVTLTSAKSSEKTVFESPEAYLGAWSGWIPDRVGFELAHLKYQKLSEAGAVAENIQLDEISLGLVSELRGEARPWKFYWALRGGKVLAGPEATEIFPMEFKWTGTSRQVALEEILKNYVPSFKQLGSAIQPNAMLAALAAARELTLRLQPQLHSLDFFWGGLKYSHQNGGDQVTVLPVKGVMQSKFQGAEGVAQSRFHWDGLKAVVSAIVVELDSLEFSQSAQFKGIEYAALLGLVFDHYGALLTGAAPDSYQVMKKSLWLSFAQYPNVADMQMTIARFQWQGIERSAGLKDALIAFKIAPHRWEYELKGGFSHRDIKDESKSFEDASADLNFSFVLPWEKMLPELRRPNTESQSYFSLIPALSGQLSGLDWKWKFDLGKNLFGAQLDFVFQADLGKVLSTYGNIDPNSALSVSDQLQKNLMDAAFKEAVVQLHIKVERFSKMQAAMEQWQSGSSLALGVLAPYTVMDSKVDTMSSDIEWKAGQLRVNGKPNESLEKFLSTLR